MARVIYSPHYNIRAFGLERLHPFDTRKYGRAWALLHRRFGRRLRDRAVKVPRPIRAAELLEVHTADYLGDLHRPKVLAVALEVPMVARVPALLVRWRVLLPMRWATMGTVVAAREAIRDGLAINLSGGYHHAKRGNGEGFSIYSDVALAVAMLRKDGTIGSDDRIAYVDLDAHQGNGVCHQFMTDRRFFIFDMYNEMIYPSYDVKAKERIDCDLPVGPGVRGDEYLRTLRNRLPGFLDGISRQSVPKLAFYNAGTDVFGEDQLGCMALTAEDVLERDLFVVEELRRRAIPTVMVLSGGYGAKSYELVAASVGEMLER